MNQADFNKHCAELMGWYVVPVDQTAYWATDDKYVIDVFEYDPYTNGTQLNEVIEKYGINQQAMYLQDSDEIEVWVVWSRWANDTVTDKSRTQAIIKCIEGIEV